MPAMQAEQSWAPASDARPGAQGTQAVLPVALADTDGEEPLLPVPAPDAPA